MYLQTERAEGPSMSYVVAAFPGSCVKIVIFFYILSHIFQEPSYSNHRFPNCVGLLSPEVLIEGGGFGLLNVFLHAGICLSAWTWPNFLMQ